MAAIRGPLAITEVHLGCTREEQMRWLVEAWNGAETVRAEGADVRAVTAWSLLGAFDWDSLLTQRRGRYEPGAFDLRAPEPRATALAGVVKKLAHGCEPRHPVLATPGWWRRPKRLAYPAVALGGSRGAAPEALSAPPAPFYDLYRQRRAQPVLIAGGRGTLAQAFPRICRARGLEYRLLTRRELDIAAGESVRAAIESLRPWAIVNAAGYVDIDGAEADCQRCYRDNRLGPATLAAACAEGGVRLATFSSDMVFDGRQDRPYVEADATAPLNAYGRDKEASEREVLGTMPEALVVRTSAFFGPWDAANFATIVVRAARAGEAVRAADATVSPTYVPDLVHGTLDLLVDGERGVWHLSNAEPVTWADFARRALVAVGMPRGASARVLARRPGFRGAAAAVQRAIEPSECVAAAGAGRRVGPIRTRE